MATETLPHTYTSRDDYSYGQPDCHHNVEEFPADDRPGSATSGTDVRLRDRVLCTSRC